MPGILYDEDDACVYVTEACNSNCIMCPMSLASRRRGKRMTAEEWRDIPALIPADTAHITVTGGEPFLETQHCIEFIQSARERFPETEILILTNGRALSLDSVFNEIAPYLTERICFAIPIHGDTAERHDGITQSPGSFRQSMAALRKLKGTCAKIEIRIVGHQLNLPYISDIYRMLADSDLRITTIHLLAMEMTGCAAAGRDRLWVDYDVLCKAAEPGIRYAVKKGINVGLYNFPLCMIPKELWPIAKESITPYKVRYDPKCEACRVKPVCGGMFYSTFELGLCKVKPIESED